MRNKNKEKRLVTAALPYVNNVPHLGNLVGSHLPADIFARYCRLKGYHTLFIGGTDEHGTPSVLTAEKRRITPKELCDNLYKIHKQIYDWFNFSYDNFSRTSRKIHHQTTKEFFKKIYKKGYIIEKTIKLPYCLSCKRFLPDRYITGTCPHCGYEKARGDQCEKCGRVLDPIDLKHPHCTVCGGENIKFREEKHLFLDLRELTPRLKKWIESNQHWRKQVRSLALGWIKEGLEPRCITRNLEWGIKVPIEGYEETVFYVWFEAPLGYVSSTKEGFPDRWEEYWKEENSEIYHFIGKDNIVFHSLFWPGSIMAHGEFNLPYNVVGLQYLNYEGGKFSKSQGRGVFCENLPQAGLEPDYWRFYLSLLIPERTDTDFKWAEFRERINGALIGNFSNFIHRTLSIVWDSLDGEIGKVDLEDLSSSDKEFVEQIKDGHSKVEKLLEQVELRRALKEILNLSSLGNKYIDRKAPWRSVKEDRKEAEKTLLLCLNLCRSLAILINPYLPDTSEKIWNYLNLETAPSKSGIWDTADQIKIKGPHRIKRPKILFEKLKQEQIEKLKKQTSKS